MNYTACGLVANVAWFAVLIGLVEVCSINPTISSGIGFIVAVILNYSCQYKLTFKSEGNHAEIFLRFFVVAIFGVTINLLIFWTLNEKFDTPYLVAQVVSTGIVVLVNFNINKRYTFRTYNSC